MEEIKDTSNYNEEHAETEHIPERYSAYLIREKRVYEVEARNAFEAAQIFDDMGYNDKNIHLMESEVIDVENA